jgi:Ran GTPase-activating protein (RanGAP) involved in mRNA processing and transport
MYKWKIGNEMVSNYNETYQVLTLKALAYVRLSRALKKNQSLIILDLYGNHMADQGAIVIASALEINKTLTTLSFHCNSIHDKGAIAIAKALETNTTLTNLDLAYNNFGPDGLFALATSLKINTTLKKLNLINNGDLKTWYKGASIIKEILKTGRKIKIPGAKWLG